MSRCFPFPPPGYEKKPRTDEDNLLRKEKHKEKKHKKDKKDKEKREHKEKRERDRGDEKQKEKKDRKEKHKEKKKYKDKEKVNDKGKSSTLGEKNIDDQAEVQKLNQKDQQVKDESKILAEKKRMQLIQGQYGEKPFRNGLPAERNDDAKFVEELDRRIRNDEKGSASLVVGRVTAVGPKNNEQMHTYLDKLAEPIAERKENILEKRIDFRKKDEQRINETSSSLGHQVVQSVGANRSEGMDRPFEKSEIERAGMEEKSKSSKGREEVDKQKDKHKDKNREEKVKTKEKDRKKEKKERKNKLKSKRDDKFVDFNKNHVPSTETIITQPHMTKYGERNIILCEGIHKKRKEFEANDVLSARNIIPSHQKNEDADKGNAAEGNLKKRKEFEPNGFLIDMDSRPNKVAQLSPQPVTENGRMEPCLVMPPSPTISYKQVSTTNNLKVNGVIVHQPVTSSSTKSSSSTSRAPTKPPHPDTKYLKAVLSVPEMEELVDFDDQDWLFNNEKGNTYKGINGMMSEDSRVWAQAIEIESADICALPYVIPY